jgi:hypothetical protein
MARRFAIIVHLRRWLRLSPPPPIEVLHARRLIAAIDAGGIPLNPARVNQIARNLGLEVSRHASTDDTLKRIRAALDRACY